MDETERHRIRERVVSLTRDLILIPSTAGRPDDLRRCHEFVKNHLEAVEGVAVRTFEHAGLPSLVAGPAGRREADLLMCAHLDVISHPDAAFYRSELSGGRIVGPGAGDMKGALAVAMEVFRDIHRRHPGAALGLAVTADEETGGLHGIGHLFDTVGLRCGTAMIPDGGSLHQITIEEKGILHMRLTCRGRPAHAARPWLGDNPIHRLMRQLDRIRQSWPDPAGERDDHWIPTCAVTVVGTENETVNRVPAEAHALLDIRFPAPDTAGEMLRRLQACLEPEAETEILISAEPTHLSPDPFYLRVTESVLGRKADRVRDCGGSDARFICRYGIPVLMSRPYVGNLHAPDEWIEVESMVQFYEIYRRYILGKLTGEPAA